MICVSRGPGIWPLRLAKCQRWGEDDRGPGFRTFLQLRRDKFKVRQPTSGSRSLSGQKLFCVSLACVFRRELACGSAGRPLREDPRPYRHGSGCNWHGQPGDWIARSRRLSTSARRGRPQADHQAKRDGRRANTPSLRSTPAWLAAGARRLDRAALSSLAAGASHARTYADSQGNGHGYCVTTACTSGSSRRRSSATPSVQGTGHEFTPSRGAALVPACFPSPPTSVS
jgi:hypothetical protein